MATFIPRSMLTVNVDCMAGEERLIYESICYKLANYTLDGIKPLALSLIKETGNLILMAYVADPMQINEFLIDIIRSTEGVIETTTYIRHGLIALVEDPAHLIEEGFSPDNDRYNAFVMIDLIPGWEREVDKALCDLPTTDGVIPVMMSFCFHDDDTDMILELSGITEDAILEYVINYVRPIEGIIDTDTETLSETTLFTSPRVITDTTDEIEAEGDTMPEPAEEE